MPPRRRPRPTVSPQDIRQQIRKAGSYPGRLESRLVNDISHVLHFYVNLRPDVDTFENGAGVSQRLVYIGGTIPITYRGAVYNIPIRIWIMTYHPAGPPVIFVRTTSSLRLRQHQNVDQSGQVYLPELSSWNAATSTIPAVITKMIAVFSDSPPLYSCAKPQHTVAADQLDRAAMANELVHRVETALSKKSQQARADYRKLQIDLNELVDGSIALADAEQQLSSKAKFRTDEVASVKAKHEALLRQLEDYHVDSDWDIGEIMVHDELTAQVVTCVAKDQAFQDALDAVSDSLAREVINLETFLKETRRISRELYMTRALKMKVKERQKEAMSAAASSG